MPSIELKHSDKLVKQFVLFSAKMLLFLAPVFLLLQWLTLAMMVRYAGHLNSVKMVSTLFSLAICFFIYFGLTVAFLSTRAAQVNYLIECIHNMKGGNLEREITDAGQDELSHLSMHINELRVALAHKQNLEDYQNSAQNSLLAAISHDLRTPLTSLIGYLEILSDSDFNNTQKRLKYLKLCTERALQLKDLVNTAFEHFYLSSSTIETSVLLRCNSISKLLSTLSRRLDILERNDFIYTTSLQPGKYALVYDIRLVERLFDNIFTNIVRYGDKQTVVEITATIEKDHFKIEIINGVNPKISLYSTNSTGIGLLNCKKIMKLHQGKFVTDADKQYFKSIVVFPIKQKSFTPISS